MSVKSTVARTRSESTVSQRPESQMSSRNVRTSRLTASVPLVWRPVKRFFFGGGPMIEHEVYAAAGPDTPVDKHTSFVLQGMLGGWFHGY